MSVDNFSFRLDIHVILLFVFNSDYSTLYISVIYFYSLFVTLCFSIQTSFVIYNLILNCLIEEKVLEKNRKLFFLLNYSKYLLIENAKRKSDRWGKKKNRGDFPLRRPLHQIPSRYPSQHHIPSLPWQAINLTFRHWTRVELLGVMSRDSITQSRHHLLSFGQSLIQFFFSFFFAFFKFLPSSFLCVSLHTML